MPFLTVKFVATKRPHFVQNAKTNNNRNREK
jgi:hypothetical protein